MTVSPLNSGTVLVDNAATVFPQTYTLNQVVNLEAVPAEGYLFNRWEGSVVSTTNPYLLTMNCSKVITAYFTPAGNPNGEFAGLVWLDQSADGVRDLWEEGLSGVIVNLYSGPTVVGTTVSGVDGVYAFPDTAPGDYQVRFVPPVDYLFSPTGAGSQAGYDGFTATATLNAGSLIVESAGLYPVHEETYTVGLDIGWNLRGLPCSLEGDRTCSTVLAGLSPDDLSVLFAYRCGTEDVPEWCSFMPLGPQSIGELQPGEGYWFLMKNTADLVLTGQPLPPFPEDTTPYGLHTGWNLIGYAGPIERTIEDYLGTLAGSFVTGYTWEEDAYTSLSASSLLQPGAAYWLALGSGGTFYPYIQIQDDITAPAASELINNNDNNPAFCILDVRTPAEYQAGHIAGAININYYDATFAAQLAALDRHGLYFVYCGSGFRSRNAVTTMAGLGFQHMYNLPGGIQAWTAAGLPLEQ